MLGMLRTALARLVLGLGLRLGLVLLGLGFCVGGEAIAQSAFTTAYRYDSGRQLVGTLSPDPDGASGPLHFAAVRNSYDAAGWLIKVEKGELLAWQADDIAPAAWSGFTIFQTLDTKYDGMGRKIWESVSSGATTYGITQYSYDAVGRLECTAVRMNPALFSPLPTGALPASACALSTTGSQGPDRITRNSYDAADQVQKVQKAYGTALQQDYATYTYSANGKPTSVTDAKGNKAAMTYDGFDRLMAWTFPSKTNPGQPSTSDYEAYSYDAVGNRLGLRKRDGRIIAYSYDALNRMTFKDIPASSTADVYYGYDLRGLQSYARFGSATGAGVTTLYDGFGRQTSSTTTIGGVSRQLSYEYDANGNRTRITHPDGQSFVFAYDALDRFLNIYENATGAWVDLVGYNAPGQRSSMANGAQVFSYDPIARLSYIGIVPGTVPGGSAASLGLTLGYNAGNQIVSRTRTNENYSFTGYANVSRTYAVNGLNQYASAGTARFTYDDNGNLTSDGSSTFVYDVENRLIGVTGARSATLSYDPLGRLSQSSAADGSGVTQFVYDGAALTLEYAGAGTVLRRYVHGHAEDDPRLWYEGAAVSASRRRTLFADHQGSVIAVFDANALLLGSNAYDEYGIPRVGNIGRFQYTGQAWIPELGMYHYKARIYSPTLGRFLQTDPIGYDDQINLYAYVANDPVNGTDPSGEETCTTDAEGKTTCVPDPPEEKDIVVTGKRESSTVATVASTAASILVPGYDLANCAISGGCSTADWIFAGIDVIPAGKLISKGRKGYRAFRALSRGCGCFAAGTLVSTPTGLVAIETISVGDLVLAYDETTGQIAAKRVTDLIRPEAKPLYDLVAYDAKGGRNVFHVTDDHPWKIKGKGWIETAQLQASQRIETAYGETLLVQSVTLTQRVEGTYNLTVEGWHTFLVGDDGAIVHNVNCKALTGKAKAALSKDGQFKKFFHKAKQDSGLAGDGAGQRNSDMDPDFITEVYQDWIDSGKP